MYAKEVESLQKIFKKTKKRRRLGKLFKTNNSNYYYDVGTGKVFQCSENEYTIFNDLLTQVNVEDVLNLPSKVLADSFTKVVKIIETENLMQAPPLENFSGEHIWDLEDKIKNEIGQIIFEVTQRCNLRCDYCIFHEDNKNFRNFSEEQDMDFSIAKKAIDQMVNKVGEKLYISFYGGEPLLNFELIKRVVEYIQSLNLNTELYFSITTNLTLMTPEIAEFIASTKNFIVTCSIDGDEEIHNEHRKDGNGNGSFKKTIDGLKLISNELRKRQELNRVNVSLVLTPPYSKKRFDKIQNFFQNCSYLDKDVSVVANYVDTGREVTEEELEYRKSFEEENSNEEYINPLQEWTKEIVLNYSDDENSLFTNNGLIQNLLRIHGRRISNRPFGDYFLNGCCLPGSRKIFITSSGDYNVCERMGNTPYIGNVESGINLENIKEFYIDEYINESIKDCRNCWAIHFCGLCYASCYNEDGINNRMKEFSCIAQRKDSEHYLRLYHQILEHNPSRLEELNDYNIE